MTTQSWFVTSKPLACVSSRWPRWVLAILLAAFGAVAFPANSRATISFDTGICNPSDDCNQSINFSPATTGTTVLDDTNPPSPFYQVSATSDGIIVLHASGSTIDNNAGGGFTLLILTPVCPALDGKCYGWTTIEFQADSLIGTQPPGTLGLVLTVTDQFGNVISSPSLAFPWEGNNGENQHYHIHADGGQIITQLRISYTDPLNGGNTIQDIHNIDIHSEVVQGPEPSSFLLVGLSLLVMPPLLRRYL